MIAFSPLKEERYSSRLSFRWFRRVALLAAVLCCSGFSLSFLVDFFRFRTIQTLSVDTQSPATFPAVSFCSLNKIRKEHICRDPENKVWEELGLIDLLSNECPIYENSGTSDAISKKKVWVRKHCAFFANNREECQGKTVTASPQKEISKMESRDTDGESRVMMPNMTNTIADDPNTTQNDQVSNSVKDRFPRRRIIPAIGATYGKAGNLKDEKWQRDGMIGISPRSSKQGSFKQPLRFRRSTSENTTNAQNNIDKHSSDTQNNRTDSLLDTQSSEVVDGEVSADFGRFLVLYHSLNESQRERLGHNLEDLLMGCELNGKSCKISDISAFNQISYGNCYTIHRTNSQVYAFGHESGLRLELLTEPDQYVTFKDEMESAEGFRVVIHSPYERPDPSADGLDISPGYETSFSVKEVAFKRKKSPYSDRCKDYQEGDLVEYTKRTECVNDCVKAMWIEECGCVSPYFNSQGPKACRMDNASQASCLFEVRETIYKNPLVCNCPPPCWENTYTITPSFSKLKGSNTQEVNSIARVKVYFSTLERIVHTSTAKYQIQDLFSCIGGQLALWLGISLMTLSEIVSSFMERMHEQREEKNVQRWIRNLNQINQLDKGENKLKLGDAMLYDQINQHDKGENKLKLGDAMLYDIA